MINRMILLVRKIAAYQSIEHVNVEEILKEAQAITAHPLKLCGDRPPDSTLMIKSLAIDGQGTMFGAGAGGAVYRYIEGPGPSHGWKKISMAVFE